MLIDELQPIGGHSTGAASVRLLLERLNGRTEPKQFVVAPELITRRTSGPPETALCVDGST